MLIPVPTVQVRLPVSISLTASSRLTSTTMPPRRRHGAVGQAGAAVARHERDVQLVRELDDGDDLAVLEGMTTRSGSRSRSRWTGNGAGTRARASGRSCSHRRSRGRRSARARRRLGQSLPSWRDRRRRCGQGGHADIDAERCGEDLVQVEDVDGRSSPAAASGRSDQGQALTRVSTFSCAACPIRRRLIAALSSGFSTGRPPPPPEQYDHCVTWSTSAKSRPGIDLQQLARCSPDALALIEPARVVVRHPPVDRDFGYQPLRPDCSAKTSIASTISIGSRRRTVLG